MAPRLDASWPLGAPELFDAEGALELLPQVDGLHLRDWHTLHRAMGSESTDVVGAFVIALLPTSLRNVDRYGRPLDRYGVEVEPLLGTLAGGYLPAVSDLASFTGVIGMIPDALDLATLAVLPFRRDLDPVCCRRLHEGLQAITGQLRQLSADATPRRTGDQRLAMVRLLSKLGRLHHAEVLSGLHDGEPVPACGMAVAAAWRYLHGFERALEITEALIRHTPQHMAAHNTQAAVLCDVNRFPEAHAVARRAWRLSKSPYTARVLIRTSRAVHDQVLEAEALGFLN